jgi:hypothetical protein
MRVEIEIQVPIGMTTISGKMFQNKQCYTVVVVSQIQGKIGRGRMLGCVCVALRLRGQRRQANQNRWENRRMGES